MRHDANIRKITILLRIIQAISDDEFVGDRESQIVCLDGFQATGRLIQEGRNAQGLGLVGEQNGFLMTNASGYWARIFSASSRFRATCAPGKGILNLLQSRRAKSLSRSIFMPSPVGQKIGTPEASNSSRQEVCAQSMDIGTTRSGFCRCNKGTGEGN